jgi:hypothetical protein
VSEIVKNTSIKLSVAIAGVCLIELYTHFLDNLLTNGGEIVGLTSRPHFTLRKTPGTHFCYRLNQPQAHSEVGRIRSIGKKKSMT